MLNRRQFMTYLGMTAVGLVTGGLAVRREPPLCRCIDPPHPADAVHYSMKIGATRMNEKGTVQIVCGEKPDWLIYLDGLRSQPNSRLVVA